MLWTVLACTKAEPPNVVVVFVDTLRAEALGAYGNSLPASPAMDRLAEQGIVFERMYSHSGWTLPSAASLMSARYPVEHRVVRSPTEYDKFGSLQPSFETLAELYNQADYHTAAFVNNTFLAPDFGMNQGFDVYDYVGADSMVYRDAEKTTDQALEWWASTKGPKFLLVHYMDTHLDFDPPKSTRGTFLPPQETTIQVPFTDRASFEITRDYKATPDLLKKKRDEVWKLYLEEVLYLDQHLSRLFDAVDVHNPKSSTMLALTSDHGEEFWEHGGFEHGHHLLGELTRVPTILAGAGIAEQGRRKNVVEHVDLSVTIAAIADLNFARTPGVDLRTTRNDDPGWAMSENTLYGPPMVSLVDHNHRLVIDQEQRLAWLWSVDENGVETGPLKESDDAISTALMNELIRRRGSVDRLIQASGLHLTSVEAFQQLKSLGYIGEE